MITNVILFVLIIKGLTCDRPLSLQSTQAKKEMIKLQVLAVICCFVLMGESYISLSVCVGCSVVTYQLLVTISRVTKSLILFEFKKCNFSKIIPIPYDFVQGSVSVYCTTYVD